MNYNPKPDKPIKTIISYIVWSIVAGLFLFFMFDELYFKICAFVIPIGVTAFVLYAYSLEKRQDKKAVGKKQDMLSGDYFSSAEWNEKYLKYKMKNPLKSPTGKTMKQDLLNKCRKENFGIVATFGLLIVGSVAGFIYERSFIMLLCIVVFSVFLAFFYKDFSGHEVKKWFERDIDFTALEESYLHGGMLTYKANGINLGATHIICYKKKEIYAIGYDIIEDIGRKIVRVKNYENNVYSGDEYRHHVSISVRDPKSGKLTDIGIELNEFQVQMVIDEFHRIKYHSGQDGNAVGDAYKNTISV